MDKNYLDQLKEHTLSTKKIYKLEPDQTFLSESEVDFFLWTFEESEDLFLTESKENPTHGEKVTAGGDAFVKAVPYGMAGGAAAMGGLFALYKTLKHLYKRKTTADTKEEKQEIEFRIKKQKIKISQAKSKNVKEDIDLLETDKLSLKDYQKIGRNLGAKSGAVVGATGAGTAILLYQGLKGLYNLFKTETDPDKRAKIKAKIVKQKAKIKKAKENK